VTAELVLDRRGPSLVVRLNRPEARNALTPGLIAGIGTAVAEAEADPAIRALILTGTGDRAFCAGMDLRAFADGARFPDAQSPGADAYRRLMRGEAGVPVIGAANGTAVGGGFELLLGCDIILSAPAAAFGLPEVKRGLIAAGGGVITLGARVPLGVVLEMTLTGDTIGAARACELGLVNAVVPPGELLGAATAVAGRIAANGPLAVAATRELVRMAAADAARAWDRLRELRPVVFGSEDAKEGAMAFIEKRPPQWTGA